MKRRDRSHWLLLTLFELESKSTRELLAILQWARYMPKCTCGAQLGDCDSGLSADERQKVEQRFALRIRVKLALTSRFNDQVRGHIPGRAEGKRIRRERQGRSEKKAMRY